MNIQSLCTPVGAAIALAFSALTTVSCVENASPAPPQPSPLAALPAGVPAANASPVQSCPPSLTEEEIDAYPYGGCDKVREASAIVLARLKSVKPLVSPVFWSSWPIEYGPRPDDSECVATAASDLPQFSPSVELEVEHLTVLWGPMPHSRVVIPSGVIQRIAWNPGVRLNDDGTIRWVVSDGLPLGGKLVDGLEVVLFLDYVAHDDVWVARRELLERIDSSLIRQARSGQPIACLAYPDAREFDELVSLPLYSDFEAGILACTTDLSVEESERVSISESEKQSWFESQAPTTEITAANCRMPPPQTSLDAHDD